MNTVAFLVGYIGILVPGLVLVTVSHRRQMKAIGEAHRDRLWMIHLCADASDPYLGRLVVDTSYDAHIKARRRGEDWLKLYPESVQKIVANHNTTMARMDEGKVLPFPPRPGG